MCVLRNERKRTRTKWCQVNEPMLQMTPNAFHFHFYYDWLHKKALLYCHAYIRSFRTWTFFSLFFMFLVCFVSMAWYAFTDFYHHLLWAIFSFRLCISTSYWILDKKEIAKWNFQFSQFFTRFSKNQLTPFGRQNKRRKKSQ